MINIPKNKRQNGFTIFELIIVFAVITILASFLILYNKINNAQIMLSLEIAKLVDSINKAKSLSISTYIGERKSCGYGININYQTNSYVLFKYGSPNQNGCANISSSSIDSNNSTYTEVEKNTLPPNINFERLSNHLNTIFFMPPEPKILIWKNESSLPISENDPNYESRIHLTTKDNSFKKQIVLNVAGQISY